MDKHTPTPWRVTAEPDEPAAGRYAVYTIEPYVATVFYTNETGAANAAHIVRCVNAYDALIARQDELVAALRAMLEWTEPIPHTHKDRQRSLDAISAARAALARVAP